MPTYFGNTDTSGISDITMGTCVDWNGSQVFTCPGSGNQTIKELSAYVKKDTNGGNMRMAVYSLDGSTKIVEGTAEVAVTDTNYGWVGHLIQSDMTPNPATLVGGTDYKIAITSDGGSNNMLIGYKAGASGVCVYRGYDYTGGFPATLPDAPANDTSNILIRCGVDSEADIVVSGIGSQESFGTPTVIGGDLFTQTTGISSSESFGTPTILTGNVIVQPSGISSRESFGSPNISLYSFFPSTPAPSSVQPMDASFRTLVSIFESGYEQRRAVWGRSRRTFILNYDLLDTYRSSFNRDNLYSFYLSCKGAYASFIYTYPVTNSQLICRFADDGYSEEKFGPSLWRLILKIVELF